jgi:outer membrane protein insertion porin family
MKLTLSILATFVLTAGAAQAAQNDAELSTPAHSAKGSKLASLPVYQDLDKIDDVNPYIIKAVIVEGNKLIPRSQIKAVIKTKQGDFYHKKEMEADLKAILKLGYFDSQEMHVGANTTASGMEIKIHVKENPFLKGITISGNQIVPTEQIQDLFKAQLQKPRNTIQLTAALDTIKNLYKTQGYLLARTTIGKDEPEGTMPVTIDEGIIREIKIFCPTEAQKQIVQEAMTLKVGSPYNEKQLTTDLKAAFQTGKVDQLQRQVDKDKSSGGYILSISAVAKNKEAGPQKASATLLNTAKPQPALPVLNRLIHSQMYKDIK